MTGGTEGRPRRLEEIDARLQELRQVEDAAAVTLLDLMEEPTYRLMQAARLTGGTLELRAAVEAELEVILARRDRFSDVLNQAQAVRARSRRPGAAEMEELTGLLWGDAIVTRIPVPLRERTLTGGSWREERLSFDGIQAEMNACFERVRTAIVRVAAVWDELLPVVEQLEKRLRAAEELCAALGPGAEGTAAVYEVGRIRAAFAPQAERIRSDPAAVEDGRAAALALLDGFAADLVRVEADLDELVRLRDELADRIAALQQRIDAVETVEAEVAERYRYVAVRISNPAPPQPPRTAADLRLAVEQLWQQRHRTPWGRTAEELRRLQRQVRAAPDAARDVDRELAGLLGRRDELRGRLEAFKAVARHRGLAEDAEAGALYEDAHQLLMTGACDLRAATEAVNRYCVAVRGSARGRALRSDDETSGSTLLPPDEEEPGGYGGAGSRGTSSRRRGADPDAGDGFDGEGHR